MRNTMSFNCEFFLCDMPTSMGPASSDSVLPHPADLADFHEQGPVLVQLSFACLSGLESSMLQGEKPTERRSIPPSRRSPGSRSRDNGHSLQMAQMLKAMIHQFYEVKCEVGRLQQTSDDSDYRDGDDEVDDCGADR